MSGYLTAPSEGSSLFRHSTVCPSISWRCFGDVGLFQFPLCLASLSCACVCVLLCVRRHCATVFQRRFYVLKEVWLLAAYNKRSDDAAVSLQVVDDKVARLVTQSAATGGGAGVGVGVGAGAGAGSVAGAAAAAEAVAAAAAGAGRDAATLPPKARKLLGLKAGGQAEPSPPPVRFVLENQLDPGAAPKLLQAESPEQAQAWVNSLSQATSSRTGAAPGWCS